MQSINEQIRNNAVALISLVIAVSSLGYNTWRNETTEEQRNIRHGAFRTLEALGELQQVVLYQAYYLSENSDQQEEGRQRVMGFGQAQLIQDLMQLMPPPGPQAGDELFDLWTSRVNDLSLGPGDPRSQAAEQAINASIDRTRVALRQVLAELD